MSRPLESFERLNQPWDVRFLENRSLRVVFLALLLDVFMLGAFSVMLVYEILRQHRYDFSTVLMLIVFGMSAIPSSIAIYRRLKR